MKTRFAMTLLVAVSLTLSMSGCRSPEPAPQNGPTPTQGATSTSEPTSEVVVRLYFVRGEKIGAAGRKMSALDSTPLQAKAAVTELVSGPVDDDEAVGLGTAIPSGVRVNDVTVSQGTATVDLSKDFESGGGSLSMQLRVAQVVYTLTQFDEIKRVTFELDGTRVKAIGGEGVVVDPPVDRADFEAVTPAVLVEDPLPNQIVSSPLKATGTSNTFEATHQLQLVDASGEVLADTFVTASSGTGTRGTWEQDLEFFSDAGGDATLRAFVLSAEDGSEQDIVEIPVVLAR